jgi:ClpP class serine protease
MKNPLKAISRLFNKGGVKSTVLTQLYENTFNQPLHIEPTAALPILHGYLHGDVRNDGMDYEEGGSRCSYYLNDNVVVLDIRGVLTARPTYGNMCEASPLSYEELKQDLQRIQADANVTHIIGQFGSCGGQAALMCDLSDFIYNMRGGQIKLMAMVDLQACSAAYGIASAFDEIWITRSGVAGSIGTYVCLVDETARNEMEGIKFNYIASDIHKLDGNPDQPLTEEAISMFTDDIMAMDAVFKKTCARNLNMPVEQIYGMQARWYRGEEAVKAGLAHKIGTFDDLINYINESNDKITNSLINTSTSMKEVKMEQDNNPVQETITPDVPFTPDQLSFIESLLSKQKAVEEIAQDAPKVEEINSEILDLCAAAGVQQNVATLLAKSGISAEEARATLIAEQVESTAKIDSTVPVTLVDKDPIQGNKLQDSFSNMELLEAQRQAYLNSHK